MCYNGKGNTGERSIYRHFRDLFKHNVRYVIIEAKMRKREAFADIFALYQILFISAVRETK